MILSVCGVGWVGVVKEKGVGACVRLFLCLFLFLTLIVMHYQCTCDIFVSRVFFIYLVRKQIYKDNKKDK